MKDSRVEHAEVGFHYGNVIQYLAEMHGTGFEVVREAVQNAIDKGAKSIFVLIDCLKRLIEVYDDGKGASKAEIEKKFSQIGLSLKLGEEGMVGKKGIGNLAAFSIGNEWQLFTREAGKDEPINAFIFPRSELAKREGVRLHIEPVPFKSIKGAPFPATTQLRIVGVDEGVLRQLGDKEAIERTLREAFNAMLKSNDIDLRVAYRNPKGQSSEFLVKPTRFRGAPLDPVDYETEYGAVTFEFYHSHEPLKKPSILVLHQGVYSVPLSNFFKRSILPAELEALFDKGYFEGEIRLSFCEVNSSRDVFQHSDELTKFVGAIESFCREILKPLLDQFEQADRKDRLKQIAESVLKRMQRFLSKNPNLLPPNLKALLGKRGQGEGEDDETVSEPDPDPKKPLPKDALKQQRKKTREGTPPVKKPMVRLRGDGLAIQIINPEAEEGFSWHSRLTPRGAIQINAMHNDFGEAERRGRAVMDRYMSLLVYKEMTCASLTPHESAAFNSGFEKTFLSFWKSSLTE